MRRSGILMRFCNLLATELKKAGLNVPEGILNAEECSREILKCLEDE